MFFGPFGDLARKAEASRRRGIARLRCTEVTIAVALAKDPGFAALATRVLVQEAAAQMVDAAEFDGGASWQ